MAGLGEHVTAMVRSHASGDDSAFYSMALQIAAREARQGHHLLADKIKKAVDASRQGAPSSNVTKLAKPRGDLADLIEVTHPEVSLKNLVGPGALVDPLKQVIAEQRQRKTLLDHGFDPTHRLLLEGPPGTGKTMTAAILARELALPLFTVRLDTLLSKYMGETASKLRLVFDAVAERRGVYLFDEFDALGGDRSGNDIGEARRILNSFLVFLEQSSPESVVIAATNHRSILDRALFRRFDMVLTYHLPDKMQARSVIKGRLGSLMKGMRWDNVDAHTDELSHADLVKAAEAAAKAVLMRGDTLISGDDLVNALDTRRMASLG
ncbi:AAA family ATPase [Brevibacterium aurantiacum]|uniref:ATPase family associated with various cellular activities (AAA) n=1 Tax=Brevibacterium aurantiacum TaxID=273384 RepID=A0A2H1KFZ8_BREAU|nr:ATP-binding protein [Brevibacterium aurantiacum]SMX98569.1 ATPase family associated with various cellular activities (AAA) [Brevibacterium aurantiacum]